MSEAQRLARIYASYCTHRGNEIRFEPGPLVRTHLNPAEKPSRQLITITKTKPQASVLICPFAQCLALAPYLCDNCAEWACKQHCHAHTQAYTFCVACQGYLVRRGGAIPLQPGLIVRTKSTAKIKSSPMLGTAPEGNVTCEIQRCHMPAKGRCIACDRWVCHHHTLSSRRRARCSDCGLGRHSARHPSLPAQDNQQQSRQSLRMRRGPPKHSASATGVLVVP